MLFNLMKLRYLMLILIIMNDNDNGVQASTVAPHVDAVHLQVLFAAMASVLGVRQVAKARAMLRAGKLAAKSSTKQ